MKTTFIFVKAGDGALARQSQGILNIIEAKGKISKPDLLEQITLDVRSRQKAQRLLSYYKSQLVSRGFIEERKHG